MEARSARQNFAPRSPRALRSPRETIDLLSRSRQAAFGIDSTERIVYWNRPCEALLGYPAQKVLGKHCFEVIAGRDENGNRYCSRNCPISQQARTDDPIHPFTLTIHDASGRKLAIRFRTFAVPAVRPELSVVVHVIAEKSAELSATDRELAALAASAPPARWRMQNGAPAVGLTTREKEIILGFAEGLSTARVAERLCIAPVTVRNHTQRILLKLDVHSKLAAVVYAYRHQLL